MDRNHHLPEHLDQDNIIGYSRRENFIEEPLLLIDITKTGAGGIFKIKYASPPTWTNLYHQKLVIKQDQEESSREGFQFF